jgi:hypothetical protein
MKKTAPLYLALHAALRRLGTPGPLAAPDLHEHVGGYIDEMCRHHLPRGNGFDFGVHLQVGKHIADREARRDTERMIFSAPFHHMDDGSYSGWTLHSVWVTPVFGGITLRCDGLDRNDIKGYILETMHRCLTSEADTFDQWAFDAGLFGAIPQPKETT